MVRFDVGDNRHHRLQVQERRVALIRFSNQITTVAQTRMHARGFDQAAVDKRRVETRFCINTGDHRRGRGFTVGPGNRDAVAKTHQFRQHFCTADHRNARVMRGNDFRVVRGDSARYHHHARIAHVFRAMIEIDSRPKRRQLLRYMVWRQVRPADLIAFVS